MIGILMIEFWVVKMNLLKSPINTLKENCVGMCQVHGVNVAVVTKKNAGKCIKNCDGLITKDPNITLSISVADCIPLALIDPATGTAGLVHAGWRGLDNKIILNAINLMIEKFHINPENLHAEIGPHICQKHYQIKNDVAEKFSDYSTSLRKVDGKIFLDLAGVAKEQLVCAGINTQNIKISKICTFENPSLPSYRRDGVKSGKRYFLSPTKPS